MWFERLRVAFVLMFVSSVLAGYLAYRANEKTNDVAADALGLSEVNQALIRQVDRNAREFRAESEKRRDQSCRADEREHARNVRGLRETYRILSSPEQVEQLGPGLVGLIVATSLPQQERLARTDQAPAYCDLPGYQSEQFYRVTNGVLGDPPVGLPEPDPRPPVRRDFSYLLAPSPPG